MYRIVKEKNSVQQQQTTERSKGWLGFERDDVSL
jgi:hypothetical protein